MTEEADELRQVVVPTNAAGSRLDKVLASLVPMLGRHAAKTLCREGRVVVDGRRRAASWPVSAGSTIAVRLPRAEARPASQELEVLRSEAAIVFVDKPPGLHTVRQSPSDPTTRRPRVPHPPPTRPQRQRA